MKQKNNNMDEKEAFKNAVLGTKVPVLILDQKWHQLFAVNGKPKKVQKLEADVNALLMRQSHLTQECRDLKKLKKKLMANIVQNMAGATVEKEDSLLMKRLEEDRHLIDEINVKLEEKEDELLEIPRSVADVNQSLMLETMEFCYREMRDNVQQVTKINAWLKQIRQEVKTQILQKQDLETETKQMYSYLHDIFGVNVIDIFDLKYDDVAVTFWDDSPVEEDEEENRD